MQITFRERWLDRRLAYEKLQQSNAPKFLTVPHVKNNIWMPDSFFPTEKAAHRHHVDTENMFLRIYPDGQVLYSVRLSMTLSCPMYLQLYPLDVQHCDFDLISYAFTTKDIVYQWDDTGSPVQVKPGVGSDLPNFVLTSIDTNHECTSHTNTGLFLNLFSFYYGSYACLRMRLKLTRQFSYYFLQLYGPTTMIVIVSWQSSINAKLPPVSYVKVVDVWLGACQTFVFGALLEYAFVSYQDNCLQEEKTKRDILRKSQKRHSKMNEEIIDESGEQYQPPCTCHLFDPPSYRQKFSDRVRKWFTKPSYLPAKIDFYARFSMPAGFFIFNIVYWACCYVMTSKYNSDKL
ncbi:unnamed protein product [Anisakis simplex]|uniref:Glutamate-gated chloride channel subunit beta (inferred by orthology to a C. elegans protein) n=1 Tax=Anisakis simplex TaxID=6269 RepID=A0A0M3JRY7_ANISI|nr:unnamed protein product [Anisakis simplex]